MLYRQAVILIGVQVVARGATDWIAVALLWLASAVLCLRLIDLLADYLRAVIVPEERRTSLAALILLRKVAKALILALLTVQILEILGFDVTTAIAALGIGGLALALGAQKTVENLVGSVNVVADRPVEVGDFCKFGDISGTVEDIGIRSTKVRTSARTIVTVPNGIICRDADREFLCPRPVPVPDCPVLACQHNDHGSVGRRSSPISASILARPAKRLLPGARANLIEMTRTALDVEIFCYIKASDYVAFLNAKEEALLISMLRNGHEERHGLMAFPPALLEVAHDEDGATQGCQTERTKVRGDFTVTHSSSAKKHVVTLQHRRFRKIAFDVRRFLEKEMNTSKTDQQPCAAWPLQA